jgi:hypothetical protein
MGMAAWNPRTSRSICGPKMPSMSTGGPSPSLGEGSIRVSTPG